MKSWFVFFFLAILACLVGFAALVWRINNNSSINKCEIVASYSVFVAYSKNRNFKDIERYYSETALKYCDNSWIIINSDGDEKAKRYYQWFMDISDRILLLLPSTIKNKQKTVELLQTNKLFDILPNGMVRYFKWEFDEFGWTLFDMNIRAW